MNISHLLLLLLLSFESASARLVERQELWPAVGAAGDFVWGSIKLLQGSVDTFQGSDSGSDSGSNLDSDAGSNSGSDSGSSEKDPPYDTKNAPSNKQPSTDAPVVEPASPNSPVLAPPLDSPAIAPVSPSSSDPPYKLEINNLNSPSQLPGFVPNLPALAAPVDEECNPTNPTDPDCDKATDQLIFTSSCGGTDPNQVVSVEARAQNEAIRQALDNMNDKNILAGRGVAGKVRISKSDRCDVFFFGVALTKKQIGEIGGKLGVKYVVPNQRLKVDDYPVGFTSSHQKMKKPPVLAAPGSRFKKRAQILSDPEAFEDLQFISTRQDAELSDAYFYREEAGEGITIIAVDVAENIRHDDEFTTTTGESPFLEQRFYGMGGGFLPDESQPRVTCRLSKMVGSTCGVARKAKVIIAKVTNLVDSVLDVWKQIDNFLLRESQLGHEVHGKYVMSIMLQWDFNDPRITSELE
ncbi:hypothetical protein MMC22_008431 [Lobaria immixta]|nr:hypothetical protein [Lobaria immixta]